MFKEHKGGHVIGALSERCAGTTGRKCNFILRETRGPWKVLGRGNKIHPFVLLPSSSVSFLRSMSSSSLRCQCPVQGLAQLDIRQCLLNK